IALFTSELVKGNDDRGKNIRRNIVRYCVASQCLVFRDIHLGVRKRFPTLETMVAAGFLQKHELEKFKECKSRYAKYWLPFNWALHLLNTALDEKRLDGEIARNAIAQVDLYFPIMTSIELICYVGWMKVAMELLNPFGEDDEDFDCNFLLDRNLTISLAAVDDAFDDIPEVSPDMFWQDTVSPLIFARNGRKARQFLRGELPSDVTEITMVPHPQNEKFDHYIQKPSRRRLRPYPALEANGTSILNQLFRRKPSSSIIEETVIANNNKPRSSIDIGYGPWRPAPQTAAAFTCRKSM
ncbi:Bestrophin, partial [Ostertagia ostertagi]